MIVVRIYFDDGGEEEVLTFEKEQDFTNWYGS